MRRVGSYVSEVKTELSKVVWPKKSEVIRLTLVVILVSLAVGAYLGVIDFILTKLLETIVLR